MPADGIELTPQKHLMSSDEIFQIAQTFVQLGVTKIRLTGGEPLVRKDFSSILTRLASLPVELAITTNGVLLAQHLPLLKKLNVNQLNISLDTLVAQKFTQITRRKDFNIVWDTILKTIDMGFSPKINVVLMKEQNDDEIVDFLQLTKQLPVHVRFIEYMPFNGNQWDRSKTVTESEIVDKAHFTFPGLIESLTKKGNETANVFKIKDALGTFGIISTVTNPFCDTCNRIRLTADGKLKNCLFSSSEVDILTALRQQSSIEPIITSHFLEKHKMRGGMITDTQFEDALNNQKNRSMIKIGG